MGAELRAFLSSLLVKDPEARLDWPGLLQHPFIKDSPEEAAEAAMQAEQRRKRPRFRHRAFGLQPFAEATVDEPEPPLAAAAASSAATEVGSGPDGADALSARASAAASSSSGPPRHAQLPPTQPRGTAGQSAASNAAASAPAPASDDWSIDEEEEINSVDGEADDLDEHDEAATCSDHELDGGSLDTAGTPKATHNPDSAHTTGRQPATRDSQELHPVLQEPELSEQAIIKQPLGREPDPPGSAAATVAVSPGADQATDRGLHADGRSEEAEESASIDHGSGEWPGASLDSAQSLRSGGFPPATDDIPIGSVSYHVGVAMQTGPSSLKRFDAVRASDSVEPKPPGAVASAPSEGAKSEEPGAPTELETEAEVAAGGKQPTLPSAKADPTAASATRRHGELNASWSRRPTRLQARRQGRHLRLLASLDTPSNTLEAMAEMRVQGCVAASESPPVSPILTAAGLNKDALVVTSTPVAEAPTGLRAAAGADGIQAPSIPPAPTPPRLSPSTALARTPSRSPPQEAEGTADAPRIAMQRALDAVCAGHAGPNSTDWARVVAHIIENPAHDHSKLEMLLQLAAAPAVWDGLATAIRTALDGISQPVHTTSLTSLAVFLRVLTLLCTAAASRMLRSDVLPSCAFGADLVDDAMLCAAELVRFAARALAEPAAEATGLNPSSHLPVVAAEAVAEAIRCCSMAVVLLHGFAVTASPPLSAAAIRVPLSVLAGVTEPGLRLRTLAAVELGLGEASPATSPGAADVDAYQQALRRFGHEAAGLTARCCALATRLEALRHPSCSTLTSAAAALMCVAVECTRSWLSPRDILSLACRALPEMDRLATSSPGKGIPGTASPPRDASRPISSSPVKTHGAAIITGNGASDSDAGPPHRSGFMFVDEEAGTDTIDSAVDLERLVATFAAGPRASQAGAASASTPAPQAVSHCPPSFQLTSPGGMELKPAISVAAWAARLLVRRVRQQEGQQPGAPAKPRTTPEAISCLIALATAWSAAPTDATPAVEIDEISSNAAAVMSGDALVWRAADAACIVTCEAAAALRRGMATAREHAASAVGSGEPVDRAQLDLCVAVMRRTAIFAQQLVCQYQQSREVISSPDASAAGRMLLAGVQCAATAQQCTGDASRACATASAQLYDAACAILPLCRQQDSVLALSRASLAWADDAIALVELAEFSEPLSWSRLSATLETRGASMLLAIPGSSMDEQWQPPVAWMLAASDPLPLSHTALSRSFSRLGLDEGLAIAASSNHLIAATLEMPALPGPDRSARAAVQYRLSRLASLFTWATAMASATHAVGSMQAAFDSLQSTPAGQQPSGVSPVPCLGVFGDSITSESDASPSSVWLPPLHIAGLVNAAPLAAVGPSRIWDPCQGKLSKHLLLRLLAGLRTCLLAGDQVSVDIRTSAAVMLLPASSMLLREKWSVASADAIATLLPLHTISTRASPSSHVHSDAPSEPTLWGRLLDLAEELSAVDPAASASSAASAARDAAAPSASLQLRLAVIASACRSAHNILAMFAAAMAAPDAASAPLVLGARLSEQVVDLQKCFHREKLIVRVAMLLSRAGNDIGASPRDHTCPALLQGATRAFADVLLALGGASRAFSAACLAPAVAVPLLHLVSSPSLCPDLPLEHPGERLLAALDAALHAHARFSSSRADSALLDAGLLACLARSLQSPSRERSCSSTDALVARVAEMTSQSLARDASVATALVAEPAAASSPFTTLAQAVCRALLESTPGEDGACRGMQQSAPHLLLIVANASFHNHDAAAAFVDAVPALTAMLRASTRQVRAGAAAALGNLARHGDEAMAAMASARTVQALLRCGLEDADAGARERAWHALGTLAVHSVPRSLLLSLRPNVQDRIAGSFVARRTAAEISSIDRLTRKLGVGGD